jgi:hypothetical protein
MARRRDGGTEKHGGEIEQGESVAPRERLGVMSGARESSGLTSSRRAIVTRRLFKFAAFWRRASCQVTMGWLLREGVWMKGRVLVPKPVAAFWCSKMQNARFSSRKRFAVLQDYAG